MNSDALPQNAKNLPITGTFAILTHNTATIATITSDSNIDTTGIP